MELILVVGIVFGVFLLAFAAVLVFIFRLIQKIPSADAPRDD